MTRHWPIRQRAGIPDAVRHREKWRLALDMIEEMTGPGGWGVLDLATAAGGTRPRWPLTSGTAITPCSGSS